jgi:hypothetical protein
MKLKQTIGTTDGLIRAVLGIGIFVLANVTGEGIVDGILEVAAAILVLTAVSGYSPMYHLFGISTQKPNHN